MLRDCSSTLGETRKQRFSKSYVGKQSYRWTLNGGKAGEANAYPLLVGEFECSSSIAEADLMLHAYAPAPASASASVAAAPAVNPFEFTRNRSQERTVQASSFPAVRKKAYISPFSWKIRPSKHSKKHCMVRVLTSVQELNSLWNYSLFGNSNPCLRF
ncbi:UNVERIFIED_CONTAM: hypothetical protein Sangu_2022600 [Sesamum angustifolium]|uniref:Uncharacterized protein n=1 Tax=Sesamum angustifolium TaxID=2727405 RepID=A0AAW2LHN3_9LAMI